MSEHTSEPKAETPFYLRPRFIMIVFVAVVLLTLVLLNMQYIRVRIFFWPIEIPAALVYIFCAILGFGAAKITASREKKKPLS